MEHDIVMPIKDAEKLVSNFSAAIYKLIEKLDRPIRALRPDDLLTIQSAAEYSGLSKSWWHKRTASNDITFFKPNGKDVFILKSDIDKFLLRNRVSSSAEIAAECLHQMEMCS